jgi:hypothetical protein
MAATTAIDPRSFVKQVPLAIPSHKGIAIQARNNNVYNATVPTRDEIRRQNYQRRLLQSKERGFKSAISRPYEPIDEPIYLNDKQLILASLGQWDEVSFNFVTSCLFCC